MSYSLGKAGKLKSQKGNATVAIIFCLFVCVFSFIGFLMYQHYSKEKKQDSVSQSRLVFDAGSAQALPSSDVVATAKEENQENMANDVASNEDDVQDASIETLRSVSNYIAEPTVENYAMIQKNLKIDKEQNRTPYTAEPISEQELADLKKVQESLHKAKLAEAEKIEQVKTSQETAAREAAQAKKEHDAANLEVEEMKQAQIQAMVKAKEQEKSSRQAKTMLEQFQSDKFIFTESDKLSKASVFKSDEIATPKFPVSKFDGIGDEAKPFESGYFAVCLQNKAYMVGGNRQTNIISVMLEGNQVRCIDGVVNRQVKLIEDESLKIGVYKTCIGGFSFILLSEQGVSNIAQVIDEDCKPDNLEALKMLPFYNERVLSKMSAKQIKEIF